MGVLGILAPVFVLPLAIERALEALLLKAWDVLQARSAFDLNDFHTVLMLVVLLLGMRLFFKRPSTISL
jgi:hypothetical protein